MALSLEFILAIAALCSNPNFTLQERCQKRLFNCVNTNYSAASPETLPFAVSQCVRNEQRGLFKGWGK